MYSFFFFWKMLILPWMKDSTIWQWQALNYKTSHSVLCNPVKVVTDFVFFFYLASRYSASAFQSGGFWWTAGAWMDDLAQTCFWTERISWADDASWCPACLDVPSALHMCGSTKGVVRTEGLAAVITASFKVYPLSINLSQRRRQSE